MFFKLQITDSFPHEIKASLYGELANCLLFACMFGGLFGSFVLMMQAPIDILWKVPLSIVCLTTSLYIGICLRFCYASRNERVYLHQDDKIILQIENSLWLLFGSRTGVAFSLPARIAGFSFSPDTCYTINVPHPQETYDSILFFRYQAEEKTNSYGLSSNNITNTCLKKLVQVAFDSANRKTNEEEALKVFTSVCKGYGVNLSLISEPVE